MNTSQTNWIIRYITISSVFGYLLLLLLTKKTKNKSEQQQQQWKKRQIESTIDRFTLSPPHHNTTHHIIISQKRTEHTHRDRKIPAIIVSRYRCHQQKLRDKCRIPLFRWYARPITAHAGAITYTNTRTHVLHVHKCLVSRQTGFFYDDLTHHNEWTLYGSRVE